MTSLFQLRIATLSATLSIAACGANAESSTVPGPSGAPAGSADPTNEAFNASVAEPDYRIHVGTNFAYLGQEPGKVAATVTFSNTGAKLPDGSHVRVNDIELEYVLVPSEPNPVGWVGYHHLIPVPADGDYTFVLETGGKVYKNVLRASVPKVVTPAANATVSFQPPALTLSLDRNLHPELDFAEATVSLGDQYLYGGEFFGKEANIEIPAAPEKRHATITMRGYQTEPLDVGPPFRRGAFVTNYEIKAVEFDIEGSRP